MRASNCAVRPGLPCRPGFTLIELIVVIAIIGVLVSLVAGGIFSVINAQKQSNTEQTLRKLDNTLKSQWEAVVTQARSEVPPSGVQSLANGNQARAQAIWIKLRLRQEFPMTYQEALRPDLNNDGSNPTYNPTGGGAAVTVVSQSDLPSLYWTAITNVLPKDAMGNPIVPARDVISQSSACLLLAMSRKRSGVTLNVDDLGSGVVNTNGDGFKQFIDAWGKQLVFYRWPTGYVTNGDPAGQAITLPQPPPPPASTDELDGLNPARSGTQAARFADPLDPQGLLLNSSRVVNGGVFQGWLYQPPPVVANTLTNEALAFQMLLHPLINPYTKANVNLPRAFFTVPTIVSAGKDGFFGFERNDHRIDTWMILGNNATSNTDDNPNYAPDNLYSYRLRLGARGD
jgi:prepilin-type N-terminal cleavage/methylation domain-containing protein